MINILYSLLVADAPSADTAAYSKRRTPIWHTDKSNRIREVLVSTISEDDTENLCLFASMVCYEVLFTQYGEEIKRLDPNNTYDKVVRLPDVTNPTVFQFTAPPSAYAKIKIDLDSDILERLVTPTWIETIAAGCLQMLREVS